jgi:hypothetical protein
VRKFRLQLSVLAILAVVALLALAVSAATAKDENLREARARLTGPGEVPYNVTAARGEFRATIDEQARMIHYTLKYENLEGAPTTQAHIHIGQRFAVGGVSVFLCGGAPPNSDKPACPTTSGEVTGDIDPADVIGPANQAVPPGAFDDLVAAMRAGATYANVHTNPSLGGEIRGQIRTDNEGNDNEGHGGHDD